MDLGKALVRPLPTSSARLQTTGCLRSTQPISRDERHQGSKSLILSTFDQLGRRSYGK